MERVSEWVKEIEVIVLWVKCAHILTRLDQCAQNNSASCEYLISNLYGLKSRYYIFYYSRYTIFGECAWVFVSSKAPRKQKTTITKYQRQKKRNICLKPKHTKYYDDVLNIKTQNTFINNTHRNGQVNQPTNISNKCDVTYIIESFIQNTNNTHTKCDENNSKMKRNRRKHIFNELNMMRKKNVWTRRMWHSCWNRI